MAGVGVPISDINALSDTVTTLTEQVASLQHMVQGLTSNPTSDPRGEYSGDEGPAVRHLLYGHARDANRELIHGLEGRIASLEVSIGDINGTQGEYQGAVDALIASVSRLEESQEEHMKNIKFLTDKSEASATRTSSCSKNAITNIRGSTR